MSSLDLPRPPGGSTKASYESISRRLLDIAVCRNCQWETFGEYSDPVRLTHRVSGMYVRPCVEHSQMPSVTDWFNVTSLRLPSLPPCDESESQS
jgi:hypothetical protein